MVVYPSIYDGFYTSQVVITVFVLGAPTEGHIQVKLVGWFSIVEVWASWAQRWRSEPCWGGKLVPCKQTLSSQCLYLSWKVVVLHTLFLVDIPKKGKGIHFDVWFFKPQTNIWKSSSWSSSPRSTRIYNAYTYLSVNEWHPASSREFADVAYHPRGGLLHDGYSGSAWPSWHVWGAAGDRGTKQCSCNRGKHSWSWICKQFNSRI